MEKLFPRCDEPCEGYKAAIQLVEKAAAQSNADDPHFKRAAELLATVELRDQFAMATMQGLWGSPDMDGILRSTYNKPNGIERVQAMRGLAEIAYQQADAMLLVRSAGKDRP